MSAKNSTKYRQPSLPHSPKIQRVGEYHLGKKINEGGFGKVVEATHIPTGHKVAIKIINKASSLKTPTSLKNLKREIKIQKMLQHKSIAALYETYETSDNFYLIMELCNGGDLMDKVAERKYLKEQEAKRYIRQIMTAVEHLHTNKIVHRDIKLENILLDENDDIRIIDFGLSNTISYYGLTPQPLTTQCGSESYAAPEILMGQPYDAKIDVWSIGVTLYAMLTGKFPYTSRLHNRTVKLQRMLDRDLHFPPGLSTGAINFIKTLLQPDPKKRPTLKMALKNKWLSAKSSI